MRHLFLLLLFLKFNSSSFSQKVKDEEIFTAVEKQAEFPGGIGAFGKFLQKILDWLKIKSHFLQRFMYNL